MILSESHVWDESRVGDIKEEFVVVHSLSSVWLSETPWTAARQASLSFPLSQSLLKFMSVESVMPSNHLIICRPQWTFIIKTMPRPPSAHLTSKSTHSLVRGGCLKLFGQKDSEATTGKASVSWPVSDSDHGCRRDEGQQEFLMHALSVKLLFYRLISETREIKWILRFQFPQLVPKLRLVLLSLFCFLRSLSSLLCWTTLTLKQSFLSLIFM